MAGIAIKSIAYAADKFPERWMEKIPYYRPKDEKDSRKDRSHSRKHSRRDSRKERRNDYYDDEYSDEDDYDDRNERRGHRSSSLDGRRYDSGERSSRRRSYNPADYVPAGRGAQTAYPVNPAVPAAGVVPGAAPAANPYTEASRPISVSGPMPGYVPYAHVYNGQPQSQYAQTPRTSYHPSANVSEDPYSRPNRRSQEDRYARDESRRGRYNNDYEYGYRSSRGYDSEGDTHHHRRRSRRH